MGLQDIGIRKIYSVFFLHPCIRVPPLPRLSTIQCTGITSHCDSPSGNEREILSIIILKCILIIWKYEGESKRSRNTHAPLRSLTKWKCSLKDQEDYSSLCLWYLIRNIKKLLRRYDIWERSMHNLLMENLQFSDLEIRICIKMLL